MPSWSEEALRRVQSIGSSVRVASLSETLARVLPLSRQLGITRLANITFLDRIGIPVYQCIRPNSRTLSVSQGKGLTFEEAKVGALMESVESWHAEQPRAQEWQGTLRQLISSGKNAVGVDRLPKAREESFDQDRRTTWWKGCDLLSGGDVWVPQEIASLDRTKSRETYSGVLQRTSLGLASGNSAPEATLHALFEIIERDAYASWLDSTGGDMLATAWLEHSTLPESARGLADAARRAGVLVGISEMPSRLGVPCYQCILVASDADPIGPAYAWGMGCHARQDIALVRCITEAAQARLTLISGARDDLEREHYTHFGDREIAKYIAGQLHVARHIDHKESGDLEGLGIADTLLLLSQRLADAGCGQVVLLDLSDEHFSIPVVKLVVPGMRAPAEDGAAAERPARTESEVTSWVG